MPNLQRLLFYNLVCRYGDRHTLLDLGVELLLPAIFGNHVRKFGYTRYFFTDVGSWEGQPTGFNAPQLVVFGRFIKDTILKRDQVYEPNLGLIADSSSMQSSPSSLFALDLSNHKLILAPEVSYAPSAEAFATTLQRFLDRERNRFVRALYEQSKSADDPPTLTYLYTEFPPADVTVTPLSGSNDIRAFIEQFAKITALNIKLLDTNAEFPKRDLFREMRAAKDDVHANTTSLIHENAAGLSKEAVAEEIEAAASGGNQRVVVRGVDTDGSRLSGDNNNIKLQVDVTEFPETVPNAAERMVTVFGEQIAKNRIILDDGTVNQEKLTTVRKALEKR